MMIAQQTPQPVTSPSTVRRPRADGAVGSFGRWSTRRSRPRLVTFSWGAVAPADRR